MKEVLVKFKLPEGIEEADFSTILRDSLHNFLQVRCNGDAEKYAEQRVQEDYDELPVKEQNEKFALILHYTRKRMACVQKLIYGDESGPGMEVLRCYPAPTTDFETKHNDSITFLLGED